MWMYNGGSLDGEEGQRLGWPGRDGHERRAHDAVEQAQIGPPERATGPAGITTASYNRGGHGQRVRQVAADPEALGVGPLDERRQCLPTGVQTAEDEEDGESRGEQGRHRWFRC
ncbi:unnamed protein product [Miscanthus lutarioriparius]|uniref:Uncharacterized protein n=1 Tax=Miscanthus lutarioriparius TaxID=422564 RepID=A0A811R3Q0_9POAL|nr:unnamed protein product [Miscanthus lutarioriparius]